MSVIEPNQHLDAFRQLLSLGELPVRPGSKNPNTMADTLGRSRLGTITVDEGEGTLKQNYASVVAYASNPDTPIELACISIFAWGGMRMDHARRIFGEPSEKWLQVCEEIRDGALSRKEAYELFQELRGKVNGKSRLPGVGPAYWTKLIHFLMQRKGNTHPAGYILDQWAGASVNLIGGKDVVKMDRQNGRIWEKKSGSVATVQSATVSEYTTAEQYEAFCKGMETLAQKLDCSTQAIDCGFMSLGNSGWRSYLKSQYLSFDAGN